MSASKIGRKETLRKAPAPFIHYSQMPKDASKSFRFENTQHEKKMLDLDEIISKSDFSSHESAESGRGHWHLKQSQMSQSEARQSRLKRETSPQPFTVNEERNPTLPEKMDIINQWFSLAAGGR